VALLDQYGCGLLGCALRLPSTFALQSAGLMSSVPPHALLSTPDMLGLNSQ